MHVTNVNTRGGGHKKEKGKSTHHLRSKNQTMGPMIFVKLPAHYTPPPFVVYIDTGRPVSYQGSSVIRSHMNCKTDVGNTAATGTNKIRLEC